MSGTALQHAAPGPTDAPPADTPAGGSARPAWGVLLPLIGAAAMLLGLAWPVLGFWRREFTAPDSFYSHGPLVPPLVALALWHRRDRLRAAPAGTAPAALALVLPATALLVQAVRLGSGWVGSLALLLTLAGSAWLLLGGRWMRAALPALALLPLMSPLPSTLLNEATLGLQTLSTALAVRLLNLAGGHAVASGTLLTLPGFDLWVAAACSGFQLLLSLLTFAAAFALLLDGPRARRLALLAAALPLALAANAVRIALIGAAGAWSGPALAHRVDSAGAAITLTLGFGALYLLAKGAKCRTLAGWPFF